MITIKDVSKLNPTEIAMTASKRHIQSVIEDLILCVHEAEYNALRKESSEWLKEHDKEMLATAQAEISELKKDAERLDFMIEHTDSVFKTGDGRYVVEYSVNEFNYHAYAATSREAIDAAIEAEGRKE